MAVQRASRIKIFLTVKSLKSLPLIPTFSKRKIMPEHWTFPPMESRAVTAFNTGNLVFRRTKPFRFKGKLSGTKKCLFDQCPEDDTLYHVMWHCEWYQEEGIKPHTSGTGVAKDLAKYLIELHEYRLKKWGVPLIWIEGWI